MMNEPSSKSATPSHVDKADRTVTEGLIDARAWIEGLSAEYENLNCCPKPPSTRVRRPRFRAPRHVDFVPASASDASPLTDWLPVPSVSHASET